ncbi:stage III sporulation protein AG [Thalassobacillus pellis]|uniref:stage III sporulation protein AG n=1 Tax=Thalassobacillus pellis TaxID=748008 RepID=UPI00195F8C33|nr:stage III sporulation protein AG [Thalassobacillus pellis]MBM7552332.1 stage III sporulation protein AG [Thalassobacillus pellis]
MGKSWNNLFSILKKDDGKKLNKKGYIVLIGLVGLLLIIVSNIFQGPSPSQSQIDMNKSPNINTSSNSVPEGDTDEGIAELEKSYEKELAPLLENIKGVSEVEVMVNLGATKEKLYDKNLIIGKQSTTETDKNGGEREIEDYSREQQLVLVRQGDQELPLLIQTKKPDVKGVLVVAKGVDHMEVKQWVVEAVSRVLAVPTHRISVMPKN